MNFSIFYKLESVWRVKEVTSWSWRRRL